MNAETLARAMDPLAFGKHADNPAWHPFRSRALALAKTVRASPEWKAHESAIRTEGYAEGVADVRAEVAAILKAGIQRSPDATRDAVAGLEAEIAALADQHHRVPNYKLRDLLGRTHA